MIKSVKWTNDFELEKRENLNKTAICPRDICFNKNIGEIMKIKLVLYILLMLVILSAGIGMVSASEDIDDSAGDILSVRQDQITDEAILEVSYDTPDKEITNDISFKENGSEKTLKNTNEKSLLGVSNEEDLLQQTIIVSGTNFSDIKNAIETASDGDIIDLGGKTYTNYTNLYAYNPNPVKSLTIINGTLDAQNFNFTNLGQGSRFKNCTLEDITFINFYSSSESDARRVIWFYNCVLNNVHFNNFDVYQDGISFVTSTINNTNFTNMRGRFDNTSQGNYEGSAMIVSNDNCTFDNCNFLNLSNIQHSGAICVSGRPLNTVNITNCKFINCSSGIGGALYIHGTNTTSSIYSNVINCSFINCSASLYGGAIGTSQDYLNIENCMFFNNTATKGGAIMVGGITHELDGNNTQGHNDLINNCSFFYNTATEEGGAVHITGDNNSVIKSYFDDNFAQGGNGSAIYVHGENASAHASFFYNHDCEKGTVYIEGNNANVTDSRFENNTASKGGAGIYVNGNYSYLGNNTFVNNNASIHGGAIHSQGDHAVITNSTFYKNNAIPSISEKDKGLGGAIFIRGDYNKISYSDFEGNTARNGSAIYNRGNNLTIDDDTFIENQAWSYLLTVDPDKKRFYYDPEAVVTINVTHIGGDNIINAIHNDGEPENIFFYNVTYELSINNRQNTGNETINPVKGAENSKNGTLLYQDDREDLQNITIFVQHIETGNVVVNDIFKTGILGNASVSRKGLLSGKYFVNATHIEDGLYKFITNTTNFEILPVADLAVEKYVSNKTPNFADEITWTIAAKNNGFNNVSDAYVIDKLPNGLIFNGADGDYNPTTGVWNIGKLNVGQTVTLNIRTIVNITNTTILNVATVNSSTYDPKEDNNKANNTTTPNPLADLSVVKLVSKAFSFFGDEITWTIVVTNNGPDIAVDSYAIDKLPSTLIYLRDNSNGRYNPSTGRWNIGDLAKGQSASLIIIARVNAGNTTIVNNVFVNSSTPDSNMSNNNASNSTKVLEPEFIVEKVALTPLVSVGEQVTFEIVVTNTGAVVLNNVFVEESSYDGLIFDHAYGSGHWSESVVGGKHRWTYNNTFSLNQVQSFFVVFNTTKAGNFTNVVVAGADNTENKTTNDSVEVLEPEFIVEKIALTPIVHKNNLTYFEIIVRNVGKTTLTGVFIQETDYENLTYVSYFDNGEWEPNFEDKYPTFKLINALKPNDVATLIVIFNATQTGNWTNTVTAGSNNTDNKTANNTTYVYEDEPPFDPEKNATNPNLNVEKYAQEKIVLNGTQAIFEIIVRNTGDKRLHNVTVYEKFDDEGLIFDYIVDSSGLWIDNGDLTFTYNDVLYVGQLSRFYVVFNTTKSGNFTNYVTAGSNESDNKTANDTVEVVTPELEVSKISINKMVNVGDDVIFEIVVRNTGKVDLNNVLVDEYQFDGLSYVGWFDDMGMWRDNHDLSWSLNGVLLPKEESGFFVVFRAINVGNFTNVIVARSDETPNKTANDTVEVVSPGLTLQKITINNTVTVGDNVIFEIVVENSGDVTLNNVTVKEIDFEGLEYVTWFDYTGQWIKNEDLSWTYSYPLESGRVTDFFVVFKTTKIGNFTNVITAKSDKTDEIYANNSTTALGADLSVVKRVSNPISNWGDNISWTIIVTNNGLADARDVYVVDKLPDGLIYLGDDSKGTYDPLTGVWTIGDLAYGESATLVIVALVDISNASILNVATVNSSTFDPDKSNNVANNTTKSNPRADLSVVKVVSKSNPNYGDVISWTIVVYNHGPDAARDVYVVDKLPAGLIYQNHKTETGIFNPSTGLWTIGELETGASVSLVINTLVNLTNTAIVNVAIVNSSTPDPYKHNNKANDTAKINPAADLSLYKAVVRIEGNHVTWEIVVTNLGPDTAVNARVIDVLPKGLEFVSYYASRGVFDSTKGLWTIGDIQNGEKVTLLIETIAVDAGVIINEARVESDTYDPDLTNNYDYDEVSAEDIPDEPPVSSPKSADELPATGNPLVMVLLALIALGTATLRRRK
ncbi:hypothetical protein [uncultured Methanobrevibacter sp.]|uniref:DUF7507 domain-containing protein n=1 Tax=uncultured Methanobrevibacter sp. TaxID=253161 RepID=UPI0025ED703D|nr:hypothetical protein [uncultured Methanobrevibacter sp.]